MRNGQDTSFSGLSGADTTMQQYVVDQLERWAGKYDLEKTRQRVAQLLSQGFGQMFDGTRAFHATVQAPGWVATVTPQGIVVSEYAEPEPEAALPGDLPARLAAACELEKDELCVDAVRAVLREGARLTPEQAYTIVATANKRLGFSPAVAAASAMASRGAASGESWMAVFYARGFDLLPTTEYAPREGQDARPDVREYTALVRKYIEGSGANADWDWLRKVVGERTAALGIVRPPRISSLYAPTMAMTLGPLRKVTMYGPHVILQERSHEDAPWREPRNAV